MSRADLVIGSALEVIPALPPPWPDLVDAYLTVLFYRSRSNRTPLEYARILGRFFALFPDPWRVTPLSVQSFAYGRSPGSRPPAASTVCVRLAAISGLFGSAVEFGAIESNPASTIRRPRQIPGVPQGLTDAELHRILDAIPDTTTGRIDRAIVVLMLLTGLRRGEVFGLDVAGVDFETGECCVRVKGGRTRWLRLPPPVLNMIKEVVPPNRRSRGADLAAPLFLTTASAFYVRLRGYAAAAGLPGVSPHVLRHAAAQLRRRTGGSIEDVSNMLGHTSIATTARYLRRLEAESDDGWRAAAATLGLATRRSAPPEVGVVG